jgi:WG repeat protein
VRTAIIAFVLLLAAVGPRENSDFRESARPSSGEILPCQTGVDTSSAHATPCLFNFERGEVPNCVLENAAGDLSIAPPYLKYLDFDSAGLAAVRSIAQGWMYVNRKGKVIIRGVPVMDNGVDTFHDGLVRFVRNNKYGFANRSGQTVIPPIYDGAMNFEKGNAEVCKGCQSKCAEPACEHHVFAGGDSFIVNLKGSVLRRLHSDS